MHRSKAFCRLLVSSDHVLPTVADAVSTAFDNDDDDVEEEDKGAMLVGRGRLDSVLLGPVKLSPL